MPDELTDARRHTIGEAGAFDLLADVDEIYVAKGKRFTHVDLKRDKPDRATLAQLILGPTGNLRAPALRRGRTLVIGFDPAMYDQLFS